MHIVARIPSVLECCGVVGVAWRGLFLSGCHAGMTWWFVMAVGCVSEPNVVMW